MDRNPRRAGKDSIAFASLLSGAYGSAAVALLFLVFDAVRGDPFFTPSLMGSVALLGSTPSAELPVRLDMVAYYSLLHVVVFALVGFAFTLASARFSSFAASTVLFPLAVFATLTAGILGLDALLFPGLVGTIGLAPLVGANLGAAVIMSVVIRMGLKPSEDPADVSASSAEARPSTA